MKILFVTPFFIEKGYPANGMPNYIYRTAKYLLKIGHTPIIVCGGSLTKYEIFDGIVVHRVETTAKKFSIELFQQLYICLQGNLRLQKKVKQICKDTTIDIIQYAGNNGTGLFHRLKIPAVMRMSSYYKATFITNKVYSQTQIAIHSIIEKAAAKRMNGVYCPSKILADVVSKEIKKTVHVIETPFFDDTDSLDISVFDKRLKDKKYLLYYGTIWPEKGVLLIADIANNILQKYSDYYIVFIGNSIECEGKSTIKEIYKRADRVSDRILHIGALQHKQLYPIIKGAQMVLLPSYMENLSNACIESMYFEKIVIGTEGASFEQLIENGVSGFLFEKGNSSNLQKVIERALELSEYEKINMGKNAAKRVAVLRPERVIKRMLKLYQCIIDMQKNNGRIK